MNNQSYAIQTNAKNTKKQDNFHQLGTAGGIQQNIDKQPRSNHQSTHQTAKTQQHQPMIHQRLVNMQNQNQRDHVNNQQAINPHVGQDIKHGHAKQIAHRGNYNGSQPLSRQGYLPPSMDQHNSNFGGYMQGSQAARQHISQQEIWQMQQQQQQMMQQRMTQQQMQQPRNQQLQVGMQKLMSISQHGTINQQTANQQMAMHQQRNRRIQQHSDQIRQVNPHLVHQASTNIPSQQGSTKRDTIKRLEAQLQQVKMKTHRTPRLIPFVQVKALQAKLQAIARKKAQVGKVSKARASWYGEPALIFLPVLGSRHAVSSAVQGDERWHASTTERDDRET